MKKAIYSFAYFIVLLSFFVAPRLSFAQAGQDVIIMLNGEKKSGKVLAVNDSTIKFSYTGETLEYEIKKRDVSKIEFGSGRVEIINDAAVSATNTTASEQSLSTPEQRKNKIAVLPFEILTNDPSLATESMSKQVQTSCINALRSQSLNQAIQDPMVTNNILTKNNLSWNNLSVHTPKEWAELLGVEYVITGSYSIQNKGTVSSGSSVVTYDDKKSDDKKDDKNKGTAVASTNSYTTTSYNTKVSMNIYNDSGNNVFSETKSPAFGNVDSYNSAIKSLIKKAPFKK